MLGGRRWESISTQHNVSCKQGFCFWLFSFPKTVSWPLCGPASDLVLEYERTLISPRNNKKPYSRLVVQGEGDDCLALPNRRNVSFKIIKTLAVLFTAWSRLSLPLTQSNQVWYQYYHGIVWNLVLVEESRKLGGKGIVGEHRILHWSFFLNHWNMVPYYAHCCILNL